MTKINGVSNIENTTQNSGVQKANTQASNFESYLGESKTLDQIFDKAAKKYGVPVNLLKAIGKQESNFNPNAVSRSGAQGIMQLMPATAKGLGVKDSFDPEQNIMGGAKYIADKLKKYDGDVKLALAAYNAGSGNVAKYGGIPPFKETQNYVKKVMAYYDQSDIKIAEKYNNTPGAKTSATDKKVSPELQAASVNNPVPITTNNSSLLFLDPNTIIDSADKFDAIFSYNDYIRFLDLILKENEDKTKEEERANNNKTYPDINYNPAVLNLITKQINE